MVDEEFAVAVVRFMHECAGSVARGFAFEPLAFDVLGFQAGEHWADYDSRNFADRKASFLARLFTFGVDYLGICGDQLDAFAVHHEQAQVQADLRRGKADAFRVVHCVVHVGTEVFEFFIEFGYGFADFRQDFFRVFGDFSDRHRYLGI